MIKSRFDHEQAKKVVRSVPLFAAFTPPQLSAVLEKSSVYAYDRDEVIMMAGEDASRMYIVLKGQVRVVDITVDGQERVMAFRHRGDCFGDVGMLDGRSDSATVIANEPCRVLLISKNVFEEIFLEQRETLLQVIAVLCGRLRESWLFHCIIGINDAESKIRATLYHYSKSLGVRDTDGVIISATLSHQSIADRVHITRETVSRVLRKMRNQHEIEMVGRRFRLLPHFFETYEKSELFRILRADLRNHVEP